jgi:hypothetical protein
MLTDEILEGISQGKWIIGWLMNVSMVRMIWGIKSCIFSVPVPTPLIQLS